jgi:hypothetical protein
LSGHIGVLKDTFVPGRGAGSSAKLEDMADRHRLLVAADHWAAKHAVLLEAGYDRLCRDGDWPSLNTLQHDLERANRDVDVGRAVSRMPRELGFVDHGRLILRVRALAHVPAAASLLEDWRAVLSSAYRRWLADPGSRVGRADVLQALGGDQAGTRAVSMLLLRESWAFDGGTGGVEDEWSRTIHPDVRVARSATSAAELVAARDALEYDPSLASGDPSPRLLRPLRRGWRAASANSILSGVALAAILATAGAAVAVVNDVASPNAASRRQPAESAATLTFATTDTAASARHDERAGTAGTLVYADPRRLAGEGPRVRAGDRVMVTCKLLWPSPSVTPAGYWYRLASAPWHGPAYAPADSFRIGDTPGHAPYIHNVDASVPDC